MNILINILTDNDGFDGYVNDYLRNLKKVIMLCIVKFDNKI